MTTVRSRCSTMAKKPSGSPKDSFASAGRAQSADHRDHADRTRADLVGNGFFKPNISTIVGSLYDARRPAAGRRFHDFLHGNQRRLDPRPAVLPVARRLVRLVGGLRSCRGRHADRLCADPVRWRPARRIRRAPGARPEPDVSSMSALDRACPSAVLVPQRDERDRGAGRLGFHRLSRFAAADGQIAVRDLPRRRDRHSDLVVESGTRTGVPDDARSDRPGRLQRHVLDIVRAGRVVADVVRRSQYRPKLFGLSPSRRRRPRTSTRSPSCSSRRCSVGCGPGLPSAAGNRRSRSSSPSRCRRRARFVFLVWGSTFASADFAGRAVVARAAFI